MGEAATPRQAKACWVDVLSFIPFLVLLFLASLVTGQSLRTAQEHADRGLELAQAGYLSGAEAELQQAVTLAPDDPNYLADLGGVLGLEHKLEQANHHFERALKIAPNNLTIRRNLAANEWQMGRLQEAKDNLERILRVKPNDQPTILLLGMVAENLKDYAKAAALLESVPALVNQRPESVAALARSYYQTGRKQKARDVLEGSLKHSTGSRGVLLAGQIASEMGDYETAMRLFDSIKSNYQDQPDLTYHVALAQYHTNHFHESENTLLELIASGHPTSEAYNLLAWSCYRQGKFDETIRAFDQAIDLEPTKESNYLDLGKTLSEHHLYPVASSVAEKAVERIPNSYRAYMMKGTIEFKQGYYKQAVASYTRAAELNPASAEANSNLAKVQALAGMTGEAKATFERGIKRFPMDALSHTEYALMLLKLAEEGDAMAEAQAVSLLKTAISIDASQAEPHYQLGNLWLSQGRIGQALEELETAAKLNPKDGKTHYALSRAYRRVGRSDEAAAQLKIFEKLQGEQGKIE